MTPVATDTLTQQQRRRGQKPRAGYVVVTKRGHQLLVRRPDGRPTRVRPSGPLPPSGRIESGQSYLDVPAS